MMHPLTADYTSYLKKHGLPSAQVASIASLIPPHSCVVYDTVVYGVLANRLQANSPNCPNLVDPSGMWMAWGNQLIAPKPAFAAEWKSYFEKAQFVVLMNRHSIIVPWTGGLVTWFDQNYHLVTSETSLDVYKKDER